MKINLKTRYKKIVALELMKEFSYKNVEEVPKLVKVVINRGLSENSKNANELNESLNEISMITGQAPRVNRSKKSIAAFKVRAGMKVGLSVTLRGEKMYNFFEKLVHIVLPRIRDFRGLSTKAFDGQGNYSLGIVDQLIFPEIEYENTKQLKGLSLSIKTTAKTDNEAYQFLKKMGLPLQKLQ